MARISKYEFDQDVTKEDFVIGSDGFTKKTRNYKLDDLSTFFGKQDQILGNKFAFIYNQTPLPTLITSGQISFNNKSVTNTPFSGVSDIYISRYNQSGNDVYDFITATYNADNAIQLTNASNTTSFGYYRMTAVNLLSGDVIKISVDVLSSNGTITNFNTVNFSTTPASGDKTYTHTQLSSQTTWSVTHSLGKYPSVTVVDDGNNVVIGDIQYTNENQLTITFGASISGKAYIN